MISTYYCLLHKVSFTLLKPLYEPGFHFFYLVKDFHMVLHNYGLGLLI